MDLANKVKVYLFFAAIIAGCFFAGSVKEVSDSNLSAGNGRKSSKSIFEDAYFSLFDFEGKNFDLNSKKIIQEHDSKKVLLSNPSGIVIQGRNQIQYEGDAGQIELNKKLVSVRDNVKVSHHKGVTYCREIQVDQAKKKIDLLDKVQTTQYLKDGRTLFINSEKAQLFTHQKMGRYFEGVEGKISGGDSKINDIYFEAEEISFDGARRVLDLVENVGLKHGKLEFSSLRGKVFLKNFNRGVKYYSLSDDVRMNDEILIEEKVVSRKAFGENVKGFVDRKEVEFTGFPKVIQGDEVIRGNKILLMENSDIVEIINTNGRFNIKEN